jgi:type IX secretion system PorP/SprF family membrane protein
MKRFFIIALSLGTAATVNAQQLQSSSFYDLQGVLHNPSTAGVYKNSMVGASYRSQWSGISGAPKTATVFGNFKLPEHQLGLGGYIYNDKTGPTSRTGAQFAFAKHIAVKNDAVFSLGIEARVLQYSIDKSKLSNTLGNDPVLASSENSTKFDAGFGLSYTGKRLQLGASVAQLVQSKLNYYSGSQSPTEEGRLYRHYFFHGSYKWGSDETTTITPNFLFIYLPNAPLEFQGGIRVEHKETFFWGVGYRAHQSFMLSAGVHVNKKFTIGYGFDIYSTPISTYDAGSNGHEILLRYDIIK